jgi:ABC-2 type transport system permease protein
VLAIFTAALVLFVVLWLPLLGCIFTIRNYTNEPSALDAGAVGATFLGITLLGCMFIAAGCWASALTRNQVVAAMITLLFGASIFLLAFLAGQLPGLSGWQAQVLSSLALFEHMHDFARGVVDTRPVVLLVSLTLFFLFLTLRLLESRRWK